MILRRILLRYAPGFPHGFDVTGLANGLTVIEGPNGIGKSTLARAIQAALWDFRSSDFMFSAEWDSDGRTWKSSRSGNNLTWLEDGDAKPAGPHRVDPTFRECFVLRLEDMVGDGHIDDIGISRQFVRELYGGYDIDAVRNKPYLATKKYNTKPLYNAKQELDAQKAVQERLVSEAEDLPGLRERLNNARRGQGEADTVRKAIRFAQCRRDREREQAKLSGFPAGMELVGDGDQQLLDMLSGQREESESAIESAQRDMQRAERAIAEIALPGDLAALQADLAAWDKRTHSWIALDQDLKAANERLEEANARLALAAHDLAGNAAALPPGLTPNMLGQAASALDRVLSAHIDVKSAQQVVNRMVRPGTEQSSAALWKGITVLADWLQIPENMPQQPRYLLPIVLFVVLAAVSGLFAVQHRWAWILAIAALVSAGAVWLFRPRLKNVDYDDHRAQEQRKYASHGLVAPAEWTRDAVFSTLNQLLDQAQKAVTSEIYARERQQAVADLESAQAQQAAVAKENLQLARDLSIDLRWTDWLRVWMLYRTLAYSAALDAAGSAQVLRDDKRHGIDSMREGLRRFLAGHGASLPDLADHAAARSYLAQLNDRVERLRNHLSDLAAAKEKQEAAQRAIDKTNANEQKLLIERQCESAEYLRAKHARLGDWRTIVDAVRKAEEEMAALRAELSAHDDLISCDDIEREKRLEDAQALAAEFEKLKEDIVATETKIEAARNGRVIEDKLAAYDQALCNAHAQMDQQVTAAVGTCLLETLRDRVAAQPSSSLARATDLFGRFTQSRYQIRVQGSADNGGAEPAYRAFDTSTQESRSLAELSSGTRVQLLMAARLAYAETLEGSGPKLPLLLDETLANSDPVRHRAAVDALLRLAGEKTDIGRQVLYFTSDPWEKELVSQIAHDLALQPPHSVDLAAVRTAEEGWAAGVQLAVPALPAPPDPAGQTPDAYFAALGVRRIDPSAPLTSLPIAYLLPDRLDLLHRLALREISTVGQWQENRSMLADDDQAILASRIEIADTFFESYRANRPAPFTRDLLVGAGAKQPSVSYDKLIRLAMTCHWNGPRLSAELDAKQVPDAKGLPSEIKRNLHSALVDGGHLPDLPLLAESDIIRIATARHQEVGIGEIRFTVNNLWHYCTLAGESE